MFTNRKVVLYIAASLDGYIATEENSLQWLFDVEGEGDNGYSEFYETIDTILIGRRTYDWVMEKEEGKFPYKNKQCYVFSKTMSGKHDNVVFVNEDVVTFTNRIKKSKGNNIWVIGGGDLLHSFIKENLVDEFIITIAPTILGKGIPLFKYVDFETKLALKSIKKYNQFAELHYVRA
jgi:dihydrofolate reductase